MTRRILGPEPLLAENPQVSRLVTALVTALSSGRDDVDAPADPIPGHESARPELTALRDHSGVDGVDTPMGHEPGTEVLNRTVGAVLPAVAGLSTDIEPAVERALLVVIDDDIASPDATLAAELDPVDAVVPLPGADDRAEGGADVVAQLWAGRGGHRDRAVRDLLVAHYAPLVRGVAARTAVGLPASVDAADLVQAGVFGLLDAIARYDPSRGIRFESYAAQRIRGAMLDELRAQDWVPRTVRTRLREIDRARERLERRLGRSPVNAELAAELGIPIRDLLRISQHRRLVSVEGLQERRSGTAVENVVDDAAPDPAAAFALRETYRELADAVLGLGERDRLVVQLYYVENRTLAEIGALLGVTESRVCQLHGRLVGRLRGRLDEAVAG